MTAATTSPARPRMTPEVYVGAVARSIEGGEKCSARLAVRVLSAIAAKADWAAWTWGANSYRSADTIAAEIGYSARAVRYAYKALIAGEWLSIEDRPGRTNVFTVLAKLDPPAAPPSPAWTKGGRRVRNHLRAVDNPGDNAPAPTSGARSVVAGGAATVAADLGNPPTAPPPEGPPVARKSNADRADARAQAPPRAARPTDPSSTTPAPVAGVPPRQAASEDAEAGPRAGTPPASSGPPGALRTSVVGAVRTLGLGDPPTGWARGAVAGQPARRDALRRTAGCDTCGAPPGEACRGRGGALRRSNHRGRGG